MDNKKTIDDLNFHGKRVLIRVDFNVPLQNGVVQSDKRISAALPTIRKVINDGGKAILMSHLGRIKSAGDKAMYSLRPVAKVLAKLISKPVQFVPHTRGEALETAIATLPPGAILMMENTRYEDLNGQAESKNNEQLAQYWAKLGDVFVNDAFGTAHRSHASNVGIATNTNESAVGYLIAKELEMLGRGLNNPQRPFVAIVGGAKVSDKIAVIENLLARADKVLIGGGMAYTFLKAQGYEVGTSLLEVEHLALARRFLKLAPHKLVLPVDHAYATSYANLPRRVSRDQNLAPNAMGLDIGPATIALYQAALAGAKTVVWNGPVGVAEFTHFKVGTEAIATAIAAQDGVFSIIGGGDSAAAAINLGFANKFTHISTGGGASLRFMEGKPLPGVEAIANQ